MSESKRVKELKLNIPMDLYSELEKLAREGGYSSVSEYIVSALVNLVSPTIRQPPEDLAKWKARFERYIQDEINKRLSIIDTIRSQIAELYEKLDSIQQRLGELDSTVQEIRRWRAEAAEETREQPGARKPYRTGIERLREEKVVFESKLPPRVQRDRLFAYFEREGAIVLKLTRERVAVDPDYWREFKQKLLSLSTTAEEEIKNQLGDKGFELWKTLYIDNAIIYDSRAKKWKFVLNSIP
jgi:chromosome segregation ATPase